MRASSPLYFPLLFSSWVVYLIGTGLGGVQGELATSRHSAGSGRELVGLCAAIV